MDGAFREVALAQVPFWFLRHGETDWNAQGLSQGGIDIPLNATGLSQARPGRAEAAQSWHRHDRPPSPLSRARVTAEIVGEALALPVAIDDDLREVAFGVQEGKSMSDWFAVWLAGEMTPEGAGDICHAAAPGGGSGQSGRPDSRPRCWWLRMGRGSGRCARRWG